MQRPSGKAQRESRGSAEPRRIRVSLAGSIDCSFELYNVLWIILDAVT